MPSIRTCFSIAIASILATAAAGCASDNRSASPPVRLPTVVPNFRLVVLSTTQPVLRQLETPLSIRPRSDGSEHPFELDAQEPFNFPTWGSLRLRSQTHRMFVVAREYDAKLSRVNVAPLRAASRLILMAGKPKWAADELSRRIAVRADADTLQSRTLESTDQQELVALAWREAGVPQWQLVRVVQAGNMVVAALEVSGGGTFEPPQAELDLIAAFVLTSRPPFTYPMWSDKQNAAMKTLLLIRAMLPDLPDDFERNESNEDAVAPELQFYGTSTRLK